MKTIVALAWVACLTGCQLAQMQAPLDLASMTPLAVQRERNSAQFSPLSFGHWRSTRVQNSPTQESNSEHLGVGHRFSVQSFGFALGDPETHATCLSRSLSIIVEDVQLDFTADALPQFSCEFIGAGTIRLHAKGPRLAGEASFDSIRWQIASLHDIEGGRVQTGVVGYEVRQNGSAVGAVQTINDGRVWFAPSLAEADRDRFALVAAALLYFGSPDDR